MTSGTSNGQFPYVRMRRARKDAWCREMLMEHRLHPSDLVLPVFVHDSDTVSEIASMPGVSRLSITALVSIAKRAHAAGIPAIALFPNIDASLKSPQADEALFDSNLVCRSIKAIKDAVPEIGVIADVALDPYTDHGHDGIIINGYVHNDSTLDMLAKQAVVLAEAGCDIVAPSDMMDGRVAVIRDALDDADQINTQILAYSAKFASAFYGPFRDAVGSCGALGTADKKQYQMQPANRDEAMREIALDIEEGADSVMVKPGMAYLDIIARASERFDVPVLAYQVSGEYAMIHAAGNNGWIDSDAVMRESLLAFKRAGARAILTYAALDIAETL